MSSATNNQAGEVGVGWSLASGGSITRHFKTCNLSPAVGDPCPIGDEYSLALNGVASRLVYKSTSGSTKEFRLEADPMWRVELIDGTDNTNVDDPGDYHGEYWVVTTPDGTRHEFGNTEDSVDWVPFYTGQGQNDPFTCPTALYDWGDADLGSHCNKAWRWNLNTTTDTSGNEVNYSYMQEFNYFGMRYGNADGRYVRASLLKEIAYNYANTTTTTQAMARVLLLTEQRCTGPDTVTGCDATTDYVDTPFDTVCFAGCTDYAPSFFTQRKLASILTQIYDSTGVWDTVAWYDLDQTFPDPTQSGEAASERRLWLNKVRQRPGGDGVSWPAFVELEAEDFDGSNGLPTDPFADTEDTGGGLHVKSLGDEDWFMFENVDFGDGAASVLLRYATMNTGGKVEFRAGSAAADPFVVFDVNDTTGDWQTFETAEVAISANDTPTGVTDLYVRMERGTGNNLVAYINWIRFTNNATGLDHLAPTDYDRVDLANRIYGTLVIRVPRIDHIDLPLGGQVDVTFGQTHEWDESLPASNPCSAAYTGGNKRRRCDFYVAYDPDYSGGDWVHWNKYKVLELSTSDPNSENADTHLEYDYPEAPEWHYSDVPGYNNHTGYSGLTCSEMPCNHWNDFRGHAVVRVTETNGGATEYSTTEHRFYQGMDQDHNGSDTPLSQDITLAEGTTTYTDHEWLAGRTAQVVTSDSSSNPWANRLTHTVTEYDDYETISGEAYFVWADKTETTTDSTGGDLTTRVETKYRNVTSGTFYGRIEKVVDHGQVTPTDTTDDRTTEYTYTTANTTDWIIQAVKYQSLWAGTSPGSNGQEKARVTYYYDGLGYGAAPTDGLVTTQRNFSQRTPSSLYIDTLTSYDTYGRVSVATDGKGVKTKFEYDTDHGYANKVTADEGTGKLNHVTTSEMDPGFGVPTLTRDPHANSEDPAGEPTEYKYDEYGRLIEVYSPTEPESGGNPTVEFIYTLDDTLSIGWPAKVETKTLTDSTTTPETYTSRVDYYDGFGRLIQTQTQAPTSGQRYISARYHDNRGLLRKESTRWLDTTGNPGAGATYEGWIDPDWTGVDMDMDLASVYDYDDYGRATKIDTHSAGNSGNSIWDTRYAYDGFKTTITDRNGNATTANTVDARGNLAVVTQNDGTTTTTTNYAYDLSGRLDVVTHPDGTTETDIDYDLLGRKLSLDDPDMGTWAYTYDDNGNLATQTDAENQTLTFTYDNLNRPEEKKNGSTLLAEWTYDTARVGYLDEAVATQGDYTITVDNTSYDDRGQVLSTTTSIKEGTETADSYTVGRSYFEDGNTHTLTYPGTGAREIVTYGYDPRTRLPDTLETNKHSDDIVSAAAWTTHGQPDAQTYGEGTTDAMVIDWIYDGADLRLNQLRAGIDGTMNVQRLKYTYDKNSNIETIRDYRNSSQYQCFEYDNLNRLLEAETSDDCTNPASSPGDGDFDHTYTYDTLGNIKPTGASYTYGTGTAGPHAPSAANGWTYTYDNNGNQHTRTHPSPGSQVDTLTFDYNNRLTNYENDSNGTPTDTEFIYDAAGNRVAVIETNGDVTHYIGGIYQNTISGETETYQHTYTFGGITVGLNDNGTRHHVVTDHLGSVTATVEYGVFDSSDPEPDIERLRYEPYGNKRTTETTAGDRTYTGQIDDTAHTGLMYYNARYYDPTLRTFISADTIIPNPASTLAWNRYSYVYSNPMNLSDPTGHCVTRHGRVIDGDDSEACGGNPIAFMGGTMVGRPDDDIRGGILEDASRRDVTALKPGRFRPTHVAKPFALDANERLGNCHAFILPNCHGADHDAADYRDQILALASESPSGRVDVVAHSYSAFELSVALELYGDELKPVIGDVLLLGPTKVRTQGFEGVNVSVLYTDFDVVRHTPVGPGRLGYAADATSPENVDHPYYATPPSDNPIDYFGDQHDMWFWWDPMTQYLGEATRNL